MAREERIITGKVTRYGIHTKGFYIECENGIEVIVHNAPKLKIGDKVVVATEGLLCLAKTTWVCWATEVAVEPQPEDGDYFTAQEIRILTAATDTLIALGFEEEEARDLSNDALYL